MARGKGPSSSAVDSSWSSSFSRSRARASGVDVQKRETDEARAALRAIYAEVDGLHEGWSCATSTDCCRFGVTGREPYPTAIELAEVSAAIRARGGIPKRRTLPVAAERRCELLGDDGRCLVYASRPFGCRTFFCERGEGPPVKRADVQRLGRAVADLSARFAPADPGPRPLSNVTLRERR